MPPTDRDGAVGEDIRLLGRLLGDVVRDDAGPEVFELVERVRRIAVRERRGASRRSPSSPPSCCRRASPSSST